MSYEADLKSHYADVSQRLGKYTPPRPVVIREEHPRIGELESQIAALERRLDTLESVNDRLTERIKFLDRLVNPPVEEDAPEKINCPSIRHIINRTAFHFSVTVTDLVGQRRHSTIITPRQVAVYLCRHLTTNSLPRIGLHFGGRDHSTLWHSCKKIAARRLVDGVLDQEITAIERAIKTKAEIKRDEHALQS